MDIKKLNPWNWFSREEEQARHVPVERGVPQLYSPLAQLHTDIDKMFDSVFRGFGLPSPGTKSMQYHENVLLRPSVDVASTDKEYTISIEVPGVDEKDVKLELSQDGTLTVYGEKKREKEHKDKNFYRVERSFGSFERILSLPADADSDGINATFSNGVLTISCPRKAVAQTPTKQIEINKAA